MVLSRTMDDAERRLKRQQKTYFQISSAGHEAVQAAAALLLRPSYDWFYPYYRDRTICLGLGVTPLDMMLQAMAKAADPSSGGREMPCHFGSPALNIVNQSSPTGTQFLQAAGTAEVGLIARAAEGEGAAGAAGPVSDGRPMLPRFARDELVYVSGGEGSTSEGEFYEAVSVASQRCLPLFFLIQDNEYAISVPVESQTPGGSISTLLKGFPKLHVEEVNGLDVLESYRSLRRAVGYVRSGSGPALVHAHTVRLWPHSDSDDDRLYRPEAERAAEHARDPIPLFEDFLLQEGLLRSEDLDLVRESARKEVDAAMEAAQKEADPDPSTVTLHVFNSEVAVAAETEPSTEGAPLTMVEVIRRTLEVEMERDPRIVVFGEDVADCSRRQNLECVAGKGGVFKVTRNLQRKFGDHRVFNTPIAEAGIVGRALGMAVRGLIPVAEIQFFDYIWPAMHQLRNELSIFRWRSSNGFPVPVVLRVPIGGYLTGGGPYHSQSGVSIFAQCPGLRIVMPSNARDAAGLLRTALRCGDPVLFFEHKHLYRQPYAKAPDPGPDYVIPLGRARTVRAGKDVTVVTYGALVEKSLRAAEEVSSELDCEVIDLRSLQPYDWEAIRQSVERTNRAVIVYEDCRSHGFGAEIAARISDELFQELDAPVLRVAALDAPVAYAPALERVTLPQVADITAALRRVAAY
jgi:2-oxoisovalerate dehydrogenase E1 component